MRNVRRRREREDLRVDEARTDSEETLEPRKERRVVQGPLWEVAGAV